MTYARIVVKEDDRDLGYWHFVSLPQTGDLIAIKVNDRPASFRVDGVIHVPVTGESFGQGQSVPSARVVVSWLQVQGS